MSLSNDLSLLARLFDLEQLAYENPDAQTVKRYYDWTNWFYRRFHSAEGAMHFPLYLPNGAEHHAEGLEAQAQFVQQQITQIRAKNVVEIGCGSGYNLRTLARLENSCHYIGIDATALHVVQGGKFVQKNNLRNIDFLQGTFSKLPLLSESSDIIFAVESFCYSQNLAHDLAEVARVLRKGGQFIIFDVFLQPHFAEASPALQLASRLTAIGFAVADWDSLSNLQAIGRQVGLQVAVCEDLHTTLRPNLLRFQGDARRLFKQTRLLRTLLRWKILPAPLLKHAMTGLLAPYAMQENVQGYYKIVLEKIGS